MFELMELTSKGVCWLIHEYVASPGQQVLSKGPYSLVEPGGRFMREPWTKVLAELNATFEAPMLEFAASVRSQTEELRRAFGRRSA